MTPAEEAVMFALHAWSPQRFTARWLAEWLGLPESRVRALLGVRPGGPVSAPWNEPIDQELDGCEALRYLEFRSAMLRTSVADDWGLPREVVALAQKAAHVYRQARR